MKKHNARNSSAHINVAASLRGIFVTMEKLTVLWTSGDAEVALKMVFMYTLNAKKHGWWEEIRLIIWGPSALLASYDERVRTVLEEMREAEIELLACRACADGYGVTTALEDLGVEVKYMGMPLTEYIKAGEKIVTF